MKIKRGRQTRPKNNKSEIINRLQRVPPLTNFKKENFNDNKNRTKRRNRKNSKSMNRSNTRR
jgi:hypothetical protein